MPRPSPTRSELRCPTMDAHLKRTFYWNGPWDNWVCDPLTVWGVCMLGVAYAFITATPHQPTPAPCVVWDVDREHAVRVAERVQALTHTNITGVLTPFEFHAQYANSKAAQLGGRLRETLRAHPNMGVAFPFVFYNAEGHATTRVPHPFCYFVTALHDTPAPRGLFVSAGNYKTQANFGAVCDQYGVDTSMLRRVTWAPAPVDRSVPPLLVYDRGAVTPSNAPPNVTMHAVDNPLDVVVARDVMSSSEATVAAAAMYAAGRTPRRADVNCTHVLNLATLEPMRVDVPYCRRTVLWEV